MNKIDHALEIIKQLLPNTYEIPKVKIYKTVYSMLRAQAKDNEKTYEQMKQYYNNSLTSGKGMQNNNYINTKYFQPSLLSRNTKEDCFRIAALASNPIKINIQNTATDTLEEIMFTSKERKEKIVKQRIQI